jgi:hypothetical protein
MEDVQVAAAAYYFISACAMCSRVARVGTRASFDAKQKNRHHTYRRSHSARMPNIRRARARTLSTHPDSRLHRECSAVCGGSIKEFTNGYRRTQPSWPSMNNWYGNISQFIKTKLKHYMFRS